MRNLFSFDDPGFFGGFPWTFSDLGLGHLRFRFYLFTFGRLHLGHLGFIWFDYFDGFRAANGLGRFLEIQIDSFTLLGRLEIHPFPEANDDPHIP